MTGECLKSGTSRDRAGFGRKKLRLISNSIKIDERGKKDDVGECLIPVRSRRHKGENAYVTIWNIVSKDSGCS